MPRGTITARRKKYITLKQTKTTLFLTYFKKEVIEGVPGKADNRGWNGEGSRDETRLRRGLVLTCYVQISPLSYCPQRRVRFIKADGGSVESLEREALWDKKRKNPSGSPFFGRERVSRQIRFNKSSHLP